MTEEGEFGRRRGGHAGGPDCPATGRPEGLFGRYKEEGTGTQPKRPPPGPSQFFNGLLADQSVRDQIKTIRIHHLGPRGNEVRDELVPRVVAGIDLR